MASQTLNLLNTSLSLHSSHPKHIHTSNVSIHHRISKLPSSSLSLTCSPYPKHIHTSCVSIYSKPSPQISRKSKIVASSSSSSGFPTDPPANSSKDSNFTTLLAITLSISRFLTQKVGILALKLRGVFAIPDPDELLAIQGVQDTLICTMSPLFFAAISSGPRSLNTPLTVVAAGMSKWLEIYSAVLMVRVLLSWFPNIPWDRQPLSAIRDLCDPYLNLFRNIIPPLFNTLDVSPLLAFAVLGSLAGILGAATTPY